MNVVIALPGRRSQSEAWLRELLAATGLPDAGLLRYRHWGDAAPAASVAWEAERLAAQSPELLVAVSFGTVVAATAFAAHAFRPRAAVLVGTPFAAIEPGDLALLRGFGAGVETLFIQQARDPGGAAAALSGALQPSRGEVVAVPGDDHRYADIAALAAIVGRWRGQRR